MSMTIQGLRVRAVRVPMAVPHQTASGTVAESPLVLTDVLTDAGISGHSIVFTYTSAALGPVAALVQNMEDLVKGEALAPIAIEQKLATTVPTARGAGSGRHGARRDRHGAVGCAGARTRPSARPPARRAGTAGARLRRGRVRRRGRQRTGRRSVGPPGIHRGQGQDRLSDRPGGRRGHPGDSASHRRRHGHHGGLQPEPDADRRDRAPSRARRRGSGLGGGTDAGPRLRRARAGGPGGPHPHSVRGELVGHASTCCTPSRPRPRTS